MIRKEISRSALKSYNICTPTSNDPTKILRNSARRQLHGSIERSLGNILREKINIATTIYFTKDLWRGLLGIQAKNLYFMRG